MTARPPSTSRLANLVARHIHDAFAAYRIDFRAVSARARQHFEARDGTARRADARRRLGLYRTHLDALVAALRAHPAAERLSDRLLWVSAKAVYSGLIADRQDWDLAETFYNSVTRRVFTTVGVDPLIEFVDTDFEAPPSEGDGCCSQPTTTPDLPRLLREGLLGLGLQAPWRDLAGDVRRAALRIATAAHARGLPVPCRAQWAEPAFFQGAGAYLVGRLEVADAHLPCVLAIAHGDDGLRLDAVLCDEDAVSVLFSFTRSYFSVDTPRPHDVVRFLRTLLPRKRVGELYISLGEPKQGKTELYRALLGWLAGSAERFERAPGTPGLVMAVFTLPGFDWVLKVIRDEFPPQKAITPSQVRARYQWIYQHDRAGRLVDAQPFEHLAFPAARFEPDLLDELLGGCGRTVRREGDQIIIGLAYLERRVTPLNLYVRAAPTAQAAAALDGYAQTLTDLARCGIFPGDLLLKNFGVTRHGRVVAYDYDELVPLGEVRFRRIPPRPDDGWGAAPSFSMHSEDVFPEEFQRFLGLPATLRAPFIARHPELFDAGWWRGLQARVAAGELAEFMPYPEDQRLPAT